MVIAHTNFFLAENQPLSMKKMDGLKIVCMRKNLAHRVAANDRRLQADDDYWQHGIK